MMQIAFRLRKGSFVSLWCWPRCSLQVCRPDHARARPMGRRRTRRQSGREDVVAVRAKVRFSTLLVLPDNEEILDFTTGDKEFWIINGAHNLCYVHPAKAGIRSNLNLITASGHVYSFLLTEISSEPNAQPDLKLFVEPKENSGAMSLQGYVRAAKRKPTRKNCKRFANKSKRACAPPTPASPSK